MSIVKNNEQMKYSTLYIILFLSALIGCAEDNAPTVNPELASYFSLFEEEARTRGVEIDLTSQNISATFSDIESEHTQGVCNHYSDGSKQILIDITYWNNLRDIQKEFLVFHELGHCYLGRSHDNTRSASGDCNSIMHSGEGFCRDNYNPRTRDAYLDELFD